jgi:hypothetical protein
MIYIAVLMLTLAAIAAVAWPLLNSAKAPAVVDDELSPEIEELAGQRDAAYRAIRELEFEHQLGNLSQQDYETLRERYRSEAAGILRQLERARRPEKETVPVSAGSEAQRQPRGAAASARAVGRTCRACGLAARASDRFCRHCGAALERICPACQTPRPSGDVFCGGCGARLEGSA